MSKLDELTRLFGVNKMASIMHIAPFSLYRKRTGQNPISLLDLYYLKQVVSDSDFQILLQEALDFYDRNRKTS